jgi:hypothetical protein
MKRLLGLTAALVLLASVARGQENRTTFPDDYSERVQDLFTKDVKIVRDETAKAILVNEAELARRGVTVPVAGPELEHWAENTFAFKLAERGTKDTKVGVATRYFDWWRGEEYGSVTGDGRVVLVPDLVVCEPDGSVHRYRAQVKGVPTGLRPTGVKAGGSHGTGLEDIFTALKEAVYSEALARNGVPSNQWLSVFSTDRTNTFRYPDGNVHSDPAGIFARSGGYLRIGHLNFLRDDKKALREVVDQVNRQLSESRGRSQLYSLTDLWKELTRLKANEMADMFWSRFFHGSITYDNIAFTEAMDFGTMSAVDRPHDSSWRPTSPGFMNEANEVLKDMYAQELYKLFKTAATPAEKKELQELDPEALSKAMLRDRMSRDALEHLGFAPSDVRALMRTNRGDVGRFLDAFDEVARMKEEGVTRTMGPNGQEVESPARYDLFQALSSLVATAASNEAEKSKLDRIVRSLDAFGGTAKENLEAARTLLRGVEPLVTRVLQRMPDEVRKAKVEVISGEARRINKGILDLERLALIERAKGWVKRLQDGVSPERIRAEFHALVRANARRGPTSAAAVSDRIRKNAIASEDGWLKLASDRENGVTIDELSNGSEDRVTVTLAGSSALGAPGRYRMRYRFGSGAWQWKDADAASKDAASFSVPLADANAPFEAYFVDAQNGDRRWDNGGLNFGKGLEFKLSSPLVTSELAAWARRNGIDRTSTPAAWRAAVETGATPAARTSGINDLLEARVTEGSEHTVDGARGR